jgi:hypothetical protein
MPEFKVCAANLAAVTSTPLVEEVAQPGLPLVEEVAQRPSRNPVTHA